MIRNFRTLKIWHRSKDFVKVIYNETSSFPDEEKFGLRSQMRRAAVSIPSNIAEGCGGNTEKNLSHFLNIAVGSACELETQIFLSQDLGYIPKQNMETLLYELVQIRRMILGYQKTLNV